MHVFFKILLWGVDGWGVDRGRDGDGERDMEREMEREMEIGIWRGYGDRNGDMKMEI